MKRHVDDELETGLRLLTGRQRRGEADGAFRNDYERRKFLGLERALLDVAVAERLIARERFQIDGESSMSGAIVPSGLTMIAPVIASVVPTASLGKLMPASCSVTL